MTDKMHDDFEKQHRENQVAAVAKVVAAIEAEAPYQFSDAIEHLHYTDAWRPAFTAIKRKANPSLAFRLEMGGFWALHGSLIRNGLNDDLLLAEALRKILPPYAGEDMILFRGESARNRSRRLYGLCWSSQEVVARSFAVDQAGLYQGGSVILRAEVPKRAIVACIHDLDPENGEYEYLVDRRFLASASIAVMVRLPYIPRPRVNLSDFSPLGS